MIKGQLKRTTGSTLLETVIYVALLAFILAFVFSSVLSMHRAATSARISRDINNSASSAMDRMIRTLRDGSSINTGQSVFNTDPGTIVFTSSQAAGGEGTISFYIDAGGNLIIEDGVDDPVKILSSTVVVESLIFRHLLTTNGDGVRIELVLRNTSGTSGNKSYYGTAILRESYN